MRSQWKQFSKAARLETVEETPVAFIAAGPWLPGFAGLHTVDYYFLVDEFYKANLSLLERFPDVLWLPGFWVEYGTAAENGAFGARFTFHPDKPPTVHPLLLSIEQINGIPLPDPYSDGFLAVTLRRYLNLERRLRADGLGVYMVASRGPMAIAAKLLGLPVFLKLFEQENPYLLSFLDRLAGFVVEWLQAQLDHITEPLGIMVLDDVVGMASLSQYEKHVARLMEAVFRPFDGLVRVFHNDTPCIPLLDVLAGSHFEVFNFSHEIPLKTAKQVMGDRVALMGNIAQKDVAVEGSPEEVDNAALKCIQTVGGWPGLILSVGGALYPQTPAENIAAIVSAAKNS